MSDIALFVSIVRTVDYEYSTLHLFAPRFATRFTRRHFPARRNDCENWRLRARDREIAIRHAPPPADRLDSLDGTYMKRKRIKALSAPFITLE